MLAPAYAPFDPRRASPGLGDFWSDLNNVLNAAQRAKDLIFGNSTQQGRLDQAMVATLDLAYTYAVAGDTTPRAEFGNKSPADYLSAVAAARAGDNVGAYAAAKYQQYLTQRRGISAGFGGPLAWLVGGGLLAALVLPKLMKSRG